jgi:hypothetical protein
MEMARAQSAAPPVRIENILRFLPIAVMAGQNARRNVMEAQTGRDAERTD